MYKSVFVNDIHNQLITSVNPEISCIRMGSGPALFGLARFYCSQFVIEYSCKLHELVRVCDGVCVTVCVMACVCDVHVLTSTLTDCREEEHYNKRGRCSYMDPLLEPFAVRLLSHNYSARKNSRLKIVNCTLSGMCTHTVVVGTNPLRTSLLHKTGKFVC